MAQRFDFWTHGITTILQSPELAQLLIRQTNLGTVVEQNGNTQAWFHIPITTPTVMEDDTSIYLRAIYLRARVNAHAIVDRIHIRRGTDLIADLDVNYINMPIVANLDIPDVIMGNNPQAGLAMSIFVRFLPGAPLGRVEFQGVGARFS